MSLCLLSNFDIGIDTQDGCMHMLTSHSFHQLLTHEPKSNSLFSVLLRYNFISLTVFSASCYICVSVSLNWVVPITSICLNSVFNITFWSWKLQNVPSIFENLSNKYLLPLTHLWKKHTISDEIFTSQIKSSHSSRNKPVSMFWGERRKSNHQGKKSLCRMLPSAVFGNYQSQFLLKCWYICWTTWHWHIGDKIIHLSPLICTSWDKLATEERNSQVMHNLERNIKL